MDAPSLALTSLKIRDFRGIESLDLDFLGPDGEPNRLVVLGGPNGGGKTTVLEAGFLVLGGRKELVGGAVNRDAVRRGAEDSQIDAVAMESGGLFPLAHDLSLHSSGQSNSSLPPELFEYFSSWRAPSLIGAVDPTVGRPGRKPAESDRNRLLNVKQRFVNAATLERFQGESATPLSYSKIKSAVDRAWATFYPDRGQSFDVEIASGGEEDGGSFDVFSKSPGGSPLSVDLLSAGQLELFLFLGSLALAGDRPGIVFIDEPELHLDPQWHRAIVRTFLALRPRAQFIMATHSPEVFAEARSYERHFLVPTDDPRVKAWAGAVPTRDGA